MRGLSIRALALALVYSLVSAQQVVAQARISGFAHGDKGESLEGARVDLLPILSGYLAGLRRLAARPVEPLATSLTGPDGRFELSAPTVGVYRVRVEKADRVPMQIGPLALVEDTELPPARLPVDAGLSLRFVDPAGVSLSGLSVVGETLDPLSDRRGVQGWNPELRFAKSDAQGRLKLPRRAGERLVVAGFLAESLGSSSTIEFGGEVTVTTSASERVVRVVDTAGHPLVGWLVRAGPQLWPIGLSDATGRLRLRGSVQQDVALRVTSPQGLSIEYVISAGELEPRLLVFPEQSAVKGTVIDTATRKPLPAALVWSPADPGSFVRCDEQGRFLQSAPEKGRFWLEAVAPGYLSKRFMVTASELRTGRVLTFALERAGHLSGRVVDSSGAPMTGVWIQARDKRPRDRPLSRGVEHSIDGALSGAGGYFQLDKVRPGQAYDLRVEKPGFLPASLSAAALSRDSKLVPVRIALQLSPRALGRVVNGKGAPVAGANVRLAPAVRGLPAGASLTHRSWPAEETSGVETGADGRFTFEQLPSSELDLEVQRDGFASASFRGLRISPGDPVVDLGDVVLRPGATVRGKVVDSLGEPIVGARIYELPGKSRIHERAPVSADVEPLAMTTSSGDFTLEGLSVGEPSDYLVVAEGFLSQSLAAVRAPTPSALSVRLARAHSVRGRVLAEGHRPLAGAFVRISWHETLEGVPGGLPTGKSLIRVARTGEQGEFVVEGLPAGESKARIEASGFRPFQGAVSLPLAEPATELQFVLTRGATIEGRVTAQDGQPVAAARISVGDQAAFSDDDGFYRLDGAPLGDTKIALFHPHFRSVRKRQTLASGLNRLDFELPAGQVLRGAVLDEQGQRVAGAQLVLSLSRRLVPREYVTNSFEDGSFELKPVARGRYQLRASAPGYPESTSQQPVTVAGADIEGLEVVLSRGGHVTGEVTGLEKADLWRLKVEAVDGQGHRRPAQLLSDGRYEVRDLRLGNWLITASLRDGERQAQGRAELRHGGEEARVDLAFEQKLRLSGLVLFRGEPLADARVSVRAEHFGLDRAARTDHAGRFQIEDLEADSYRVGVTHGQRPVIHNGRVTLDEDLDLLIDLEAVVVEGTVIDVTTGEPLSGVLVSLRHEPGPETTEFMVASNTGADGRFTLPLVPPGSYQVQARAAGYVDANQALEVPRGTGITGLELRLASTTGMELVVRLSSGRPPAQVHYLAVSGADGSIIAGSQVPDVEGRVRLPTPPTGEWSLRVGAPSGAMVEVPAGSPGTTLSLELPPTGTLAVRVPALTTSDFRGEVRALGADGRPVRRLGPGGALIEAWPMVAGRSILEDLPLGTWTLVAGAPEGRQWSATVTFPGPPMTVVDLE